MSALKFGTLNLIASVSIILVNKQIVSARNFHFILTLLTLNFLTTSGFLAVLVRCGWIQEKHLPPRDRWLVALMAVLTVLLNNANVEANSVGFYQITKLLIIPSVIMIERLGGTYRSYSPRIVCSLLVASLGVGIATVSDFEVNVRGSILACFSVLLTARYQIWQGAKQHEHGLDAMQITHSVSLPQAQIGIVASLVLDVWQPELKSWMLLRSGGLLEHDIHGTDVYWIIACCCIAVVMNLSTYGILGCSSPVTYQVIGQLKTCLIIGLGYAFFDVKAPPMWLLVRFTGVGIAVIGIFTYGLLKAEEQRKRTS